MSDAMPITAAEIRTIRERLGMTQQDFADRIHVTREAVAQWETDRCTPRGPAEFLIRQLSVEADIAATKRDTSAKVPS
jgi:DNA-binding transcriptional regulator YiaG